MVTSRVRVTLDSMSRDVHDYPRFRAIRSLVLLLWDKAVKTLGYDRREWESLMEAIEQLARKGLGLPADLGTETPTPLRIQTVVVLGTTDGTTWTEIGRFAAEAPILPILDIRKYQLIRFDIDRETKVKRHVNGRSDS